MKNNEDVTILVIDDEDSIRDSYNDYLEDQEFIVLTADNGARGIEIFENEKVDLILVDLRMPGMDGLEVISRISKISPSTPLIVSTGTGIMNDIVEAMNKGAWDYLIKPIREFSILLKTLNNALEKAHLMKENKINRQYIENMVKNRIDELKKTHNKLKRRA